MKIFILVAAMFSICLLDCSRNAEEENFYSIEITDHELFLACKKIKIKEFCLNLPKGFNKINEENSAGGRLVKTEFSNGQSLFVVLYNFWKVPDESMLSRPIYSSSKVSESCSIISNLINTENNQTVTMLECVSNEECIKQEGKFDGKGLVYYYFQDNRNVTVNSKRLLFDSIVNEIKVYDFMTIEQPVKYIKAINGVAFKCDIYAGQYEIIKSENEKSLDVLILADSLNSIPIYFDILDITQCVLNEIKVLKSIRNDDIENAVFLGKKKNSKIDSQRMLVKLKIYDSFFKNDEDFDLGYNYFDCVYINPDLASSLVDSSECKKYLKGN